MRAYIVLVASLLLLASGSACTQGPRRRNDHRAPCHEPSGFALARPPGAQDHNPRHVHAYTVPHAAHAKQNSLYSFVPAHPMDLFLSTVIDFIFSVVKWTFILGVGFLVGNVAATCRGSADRERRSLRARDAENSALGRALTALRAAASLAPNAGFDAATSILCVARDTTLPSERLHLYVVDRDDPLARPATTHGAAGPIAVMTLDMMQQRWPRLFERCDGQRAAGASKALALLAADITESGSVVAKRLCVGQATLDAEFGPRDDPVVERVRALVAGVAPS